MHLLAKRGFAYIYTHWEHCATPLTYTVTPVRLVHMKSGFR